MRITIEIPDSFGTKIEREWGDLSKKVVMDLALEAYRKNLIGTAELGEILDLSSRLQVHEFLKASGVYLNYDEEELERDLETIQQLRAR
jgi:predicted HTH domain antitoxin